MSWLTGFRSFCRAHADELVVQIEYDLYFAMNNSEGNSTDNRQIMVLILAIVLLSISAIVTWRYGLTGSAKFVAAATGRVGLVMGALWLAWPSLRRPARWLPPGFAIMGVVVLVVLAAQPRLIIVAIPALGVLLALATVVRSFRP